MQTDSERSIRKLQETSHHSRRQKLNQWRDQLQVDRLLGLIYDFFWISADNEAILDLRDLSKVQLKNDSVQAFDTKWDEVLSANHWQTYRQHIGESVPDVIWKVGRNEILVASQRSREDSRRQEIWLLQIEINAQRHLEQKRKDSHFKARNRDEERLAIGAPRRGKAKGTGKRTCRKERRERSLHPLDHKRPMFIWRSMRIQSKTRTRKAKGRDDFVHLLRQVHRTEIRKVTEKVAMTAEVLKAHQHLLAHVREESEQTTLYKLQERRLPERKLFKLLACSRMCKIHSSQVYADSETSVHTNTQQNLLMKRTIQHRLLLTFHRMMNDRCKFGFFFSDDKTQYRVWLRHLANKYVLKNGWDLHLESSRPDVKVSDVRTLQHAGKDPSSGRCAWKKWQGHQLGSCTKACAMFQVRILRIGMGSSNQVLRAMFLHFLKLRRKRESIVDSGALTSYDE